MNNILANLVIPVNVRLVVARPRPLSKERWYRRLEVAEACQEVRQAVQAWYYAG